MTRLPRPPPNDALCGAVVAAVTCDMSDCTAQNVLNDPSAEVGLFRWLKGIRSACYL